MWSIVLIFLQSVCLEEFQLIVLVGAFDPAELYETPNHQTVSSNPAVANLFLSLGKIVSVNCFADLSVSGSC